MRKIKIDSDLLFTLNENANVRDGFREQTCVHNVQFSCI